jgi:RNA polymerase sigma-70 factor, ECF subfamily
MKERSGRTERGGVVDRIQAADGLGTDASHTAESLETLYRQEYRRIRLLAWRFGLPEDELDDAAQDVFARVCAGFHRFRGDCALSTWLTRIAVNHFTLRRRALFRHIRTFRPYDDAAERAPGKDGPSSEAREAHERAVVCVRRLPVKLRKVFVLRHLEEMSCREVAGTLDIPEATVRTRSYHACRKLRGMMKGYEP